MSLTLSSGHGIYVANFVILKVLKGNTDEINEMKFIIRSAIEMDEASIRREEEAMACLWKENRVISHLHFYSHRGHSTNSQCL